MRILRREAFLAMPAGTIYAKGKPWYFDGLTIKFDTTPNGGDWFQLDPAWIGASGEEDQFNRLEQMLADGVSYSMQNAIGRDGYFDSEELFLVFEKDDLIRLREYINIAIELC